MKTIKFVFLALLTVNLYSQPYEDSFINPIWDFYSFNYLNSPAAGRGFTGIAAQNDITGNLLNPASINLGSKYQVNLQYTYKTSNDWLKPLVNDTYIEHQLFSGSAAFGYRINKNFQTGLIYNNPASMHFSLGEITNINGSTTDYYYNVVFHALSLPLVYQKKNYSLGISLSYYLTKTTAPGEPTIQPDGYSATSWMIRGQAGFIYNFPAGLSIGAKVMSGGKSKMSNNYETVAQEQNPPDAVYPWKAGAGIQYKIPNSGIKLLLDYNYTYHNMKESLNDRHDIHAGIENNLNKNWIIRGGLFTLFDYRSKEPDWIDPVGKWDQFFITLGAGYRQKDFEFNVAFLTSTYSSGIIKTYYLNGGLTFNF